MCYLSQKRAHEEKESGVTMTTNETVNGNGKKDDTVKKRRMENDTNIISTVDMSKSPKTIQERDGKEQSLNGISPDESDSKYDGNVEGEEGVDVDMEEPTLFLSPSRALCDVNIMVDCCSEGKPVTISPHDQREKYVTNNGQRSPHVSKAVVTLYSLQQLEELCRSVPLSMDGVNESRDDIGISSSFSSCVLRLRAGETVIIVLHYGKVNGDILPQQSTDELSKCRIFCLDLNNLPLYEYQNNTQSVQLMDYKEHYNSTSLLRLPTTDVFLSLATQTTRDMGYVVQRVSSLFCVEDILNSNDSTLSVISDSKKETHKENNNNNNNTHLTSTLSRYTGEELKLPAMVVWRAKGGPLDEYIHKDNGGNKNQSVSVMNILHGKPLQVKQLTSVDQLHSLSLLTPIYTIPHFLRTVFKTALSSTSSGTRSLIYFGASWCPPCMRIVNVLPEMIKEDFPDNLTCIVKADMDLATPVFEFFGVEIIPTFIIFDNDILRGAGDWNVLHSSSTSEESLQSLYNVLRRSELGRIQNSQRLFVRTFIENHSGALRFDEDF